MDSWTPVIGETLLLKREPTNPRDKNAVALYKDDAVVGHVPYNLAPYLSRFLARDVNKATVCRGDWGKGQLKLNGIWVGDTVCIQNL